jgi:hypothetical protein
MARPRRARHRVRCRAADRRQPGVGAPGPARDGRPQQHRPGSTCRRGAPARAAGAYHLGFMLGPRVNAVAVSGRPISARGSCPATP